MEKKVRTRSEAAAEWTRQECLILVNEISAVEGDCRNTLSSFQKWKMIVQNCNALEVHRNLNQCKRKWDSLLSDYHKANLDAELFKAIHEYVRVNEGRSDSEGQDVDDDDNDVDETDLLHTSIVAEPVSPPKKQKRRSVAQKYCRNERGMPQKISKSEKLKFGPCSSDEKVKCPEKFEGTKVKAEESSSEEKVEMMTAQLQKSAAQINTILSGELRKEMVQMDYRLGDLKSCKAIETDVTRRKGDELIACLGNSACTLDQLCQLLQNN